MDKSARRIWCNTICDGPVAVLPVAVLPVAVLPVAVLPVAVLPVAVLPVAVLPVAVLPVASHLSYCILRLTESSSSCNNAQRRHLCENLTMSGKRTDIRIVLRCGLDWISSLYSRFKPVNGTDYSVVASFMPMKCLSHRD
ncbi:hypothetical protein [Bifidobacterium boum]|uniref:hypothetical protein n=1 Tax=Bifidobacterium boum TaxID=78343 RepID=UPI00242ECD2D|nr:hypothetical protein [Bifidobacterium boum]MCI5861438.1 hypothetical protein [Bifidobacterium boum]